MRSQREGCQGGPQVWTIAIAGAAGSGKTTLGRALAEELRLPLLDLDSLTNPLLDQVPTQGWTGHWLASPHREAIRQGRYAALRAAARDVVETAGGCVMVAPFTRELQGGDEWAALTEAVGAPVHVVHLSGDPDLLASRRLRRAAPRDDHRPPGPGPERPAIPVVAVDADLTTPQQLARVLPALGCRKQPVGSTSLFAAAFEALLVDLDGTLVDSTASVIRSWRRMAAELGVSTEGLHENHGQTARTLMESALPHSAVDRGLALIEDLEVADAGTVTPAPGAAEMWGAIPEERRAIVTSGSRRVAAARLTAAGFAVPRILVTAEDVRTGKPDPEPYLRAAAGLGADPGRCLVLEDAAAGVLAAKSAGCRVLAIAGTVPVPGLVAAGADLVLDGLDRLGMSSGPDGVTLRLIAPERPRTT